jgi:hypothetical protein
MDLNVYITPLFMSWICTCWFVSTSNAIDHSCSYCCRHSFTNLNHFNDEGWIETIRRDLASKFCNNKTENIFIPVAHTHFKFPAKNQIWHIECLGLILNLISVLVTNNFLERGEKKLKHIWISITHNYYFLNSHKTRGTIISNPLSP